MASSAPLVSTCVTAAPLACVATVVPSALRLEAVSVVPFVTVTTSSPVPRRFEVVLHVNDPDEPTPIVEVLVP